MINENIEVVIWGFPDPFYPNVIDFRRVCLLKDSLHVMNKHIEELNLNETEKMYYQFSVLLFEDDGHFKLVYSYCCDGDITVKDEFEDLLHFTSHSTVEVYKGLSS